MSKTLDQERVLDARKRRPQESTPPTVQAPPQAPTLEAPRPDADRPVPPTVTSSAAETRPVRRRRVLRAAVLILLLKSAFIGIVRPPLAVPEMARTMDWVADHWPPRAPQPMPRVVPAAVVRPSVARPAQDPASAPPAVHERLPEPSIDTLPTASDAPRHRRLAMNPLAPRSTALEDTRKVLRLMESALQDAAHAVRTAQADSD